MSVHSRVAVHAAAIHARRAAWIPRHTQPNRLPLMASVSLVPFDADPELEALSFRMSSTTWLALYGAFVASVPLNPVVKQIDTEAEWISLVLGLFLLYFAGRAYFVVDEQP